MSFLNNRTWYMQALAEAGWPIHERDITLIEDEMAKAERFMQQSRDLRNITGGKEDVEELTVYSDKGSARSGLSDTHREISKSKESVSSSGSSSSSSSKSTAKSEGSKSSKGSKGSSQGHLQSLEVIPQYP